MFILFNSSIYSYNYVLCALPQYHHLGITELGVGPYIEDEGTGDLRYVQVHNNRVVDEFSPWL